MNTLKEDIEVFLEKHNKKPSDVRYVIAEASILGGAEFWEWVNFDYEEAILSIGDYPNNNIEIVGDDWWVVLSSRTGSIELTFHQASPMPEWVQELI